jgi:hypothetical protein
VVRWTGKRCQNDRNYTFTNLNAFGDVLGTFSAKLIVRKIEARHSPHILDGTSKGDNAISVVFIVVILRAPPRWITWPAIWFEGPFSKIIAADIQGGQCPIAGGVSDK